MSPAQGSVRRTTPSSARAGQISARALWAAHRGDSQRTEELDRDGGAERDAFDGGEECDGHQSGGDAQPQEHGDVGRRSARNGGRATARKMSAPTLSLSQAVPAGPPLRSDPLTGPSSAGPRAWRQRPAPTAARGHSWGRVGSRLAPSGLPVTDRACPGVDEHVSLFHWLACRRLSGGGRRRRRDRVGSAGRPGPRLRRGAPHRSWVRARRG